jgi:hypothetical protein
VPLWPGKAVNTAKKPKKNSVPNLAVVTSSLGVAAPNLLEVSSGVGGGGSAIGAFHPCRSFEEPLHLFDRKPVLAPGWPGRNIGGRREALQ